VQVNEFALKAASIHPNAALIDTFYAAFQRRDAAGMGACYAPAVAFQDPVFDVAGWRARAMWRMLCERGKDLRVTVTDIQGDATTGSARWEVWYTFSATGRQVHNVIAAHFDFAEGRILRHVDRFDLHRWASQALGLKGSLLGWAPPVQRAIRRQAARGLDAFIAARGLTEATA
jgi:ketosteroid isomerase-like protein